MHYYVADWMKAVGDDPARQKRAKAVLKGQKITYDTYEYARPVKKNTTIVDVNFTEPVIEYEDGFHRKKMTGLFELKNYKPRFAGEPPALPE